MKSLGTPLLSLAAPLLICLAFFGFLQRQDNDRLQTLPAFVVGIGLIITGALGRSHRRKKILTALLQTKLDENRTS